MDTSKIIRGVVSSGRYTVTAPIVKEDYGLYLKIEGVELPSTYEVDFSNSENSGTSVTMIGNSDGVLIPHQFIDSGKDVFAFLYHVGADFGRTVYKFRIPNKVRPDRTDEQPTPEEQSTIDQAINALNTAVEQTAQNVSASATNAQSALNASFSASADADRAEQSATDAQESASQASASASASAQSASQSAQIKADVEDLADDAQASADASERSASNAYTYATSAERSSVNASASAQSASGYASQAQLSAQTASAKAQDASQSATTASQKATESAQSATNASQSAQTAEQAKTASQTAQGLAESARDSAVQAKSDVQDLADGIDTRLVDVEADVIKAFPTDTASGAVVSFTDGADGLPLKSLVVSIVPKQDGTGDPSPDNVRPISGWTGMQLNVNGTVIPISWQTEAGTVYGGKLDVLSGVLTVEFADVDLGTLKWTYQSSYHRFNSSGIVSMVKIPSSSNVNVGGLCSAYVVRSVSQVILNDNGLGVSTSGTVGIIDTRFTDPTEFKTAVDGVHYVYPLATPIEIQLDAHAINSLYGQNNIFADTGDTEVEYRADTKLYIERLTAPDSEDMIADANITSGQYFMVGNSLYKATANIANGGAIVVGTNCIRKSLSEALNEINA